MSHLHDRPKTIAMQRTGLLKSLFVEDIGESEGRIVRLEWVNPLRCAVGNCLARLIGLLFVILFCGIHPGGFNEISRSMIVAPDQVTG